MKIYNKSLGEVYDLMPWQYRVVVVASISFLIFIAFYIPISLFFTYTKPPQPGPIRFQGVKENVSVLDPTIAVDASAKKALMSLTIMDRSPSTKQIVVGVRVAQSSLPGCSEWLLLPQVGFEPRSEQLLAPDDQVLAQGTWRYETSSIVHDPEDKGREWKMYAYKYFWNGNMNLARRYGAIVASYAPAAEGPWTAEEWLFSPQSDWPPMPYESLVQNHLNGLDASLKDTVFYARPSVVFSNGVLLMSLSAFGNDPQPEKIVLFYSLDHGKTWGYAGTPLYREDMPKLGKYTHIQGASLLMEKGQVYLSAVVGNEKQVAMGTFILPFANVSKGVLQRNKTTSAPLVLKKLPLHSTQPTSTGGGFSAYNEACKIGVVESELSGVTGSFQLFRTYKKLLSDN